MHLKLLKGDVTPKRKKILICTAGDGPLDQTTGLASPAQPRASQRASVAAGERSTHQSSIPSAHRAWSSPHREGPHQHSGTKLRQHWLSSSESITKRHIYIYIYFNMELIYVFFQLLKCPPEHWAPSPPTCPPASLSPGYPSPSAGVTPFFEGRVSQQGWQVVRGT